MKKKVLILLTVICIVAMSVVSVFHATASGETDMEQRVFTEVLPTMNADGAVVGQIYRIANVTEAYAPVYVRFYFYIGEAYEKLFSTIMELEYNPEYVQIDENYCICESGDYSIQLLQNGKGNYNLIVNSQNKNVTDREPQKAVAYAELRFYLTDEGVDFAGEQVAMSDNKIEIGLHLYDDETYNVVTDRNSLDVIPLDADDLEIISAYVQLAYSTVHYEVGKGYSTEMSAYDDAYYPVGMEFVPQDGYGLAYEEKNIRKYRKIIPSRKMSESIGDTKFQNSEEEETVTDNSDNEILLLSSPNNLIKWNGTEDGLLTVPDEQPSSAAVLSVETINTSMLFSHWLADTGETYYPNDGKLLRMPTDGITLYAVYSTDLDNDMIPDDQEFKLRYRLRDGDMDYLALKECSEGSFYYETDDAGNEYACINIVKGHKIGDAIPEIMYPNEYYFGIWKFDHFAVGTEMYADTDEFAEIIPYEDTLIEVCTMLDDNENGHDDRLNGILYFYPYDTTDFDTAEPLKVYPVSDNAVYIIYNDVESKYNAIYGYMDSDVKYVVLPYMEDLENHSHFLEWKFSTLDENDDGYIDEIEVTPIYSDLQEIKLFDTITPNENPNAADPRKEDVYRYVPVGAYVVHRDRFGVHIQNTIVENRQDYITNNVQLIENPALDGSFNDLPSRDEENDPFAGWIVGEMHHELVNGRYLELMFLDPYYAKKVQMTIVDPKSRMTTKDDIILEGYDCLLVPSDSTYEILDGDGNSLQVSPIPNNGIITLQYTEKIMPRNSQGNIFRQEWKVERETTSTGSWNYRIIPLYTEPQSTEYDVEAMRTGYGEIILGGNHMDDDIAEMSFYVRIMDIAAEQIDLQFLKMDAAVVCGFENTTAGAKLISDDYWLTCEGTAHYRGREWGIVTLHYRTKNSGIVWCSLHCKNERRENGYYIVTVGDCSVDGRINSVDITKEIEFANDLVPVPYSGYNTADETNSYRFELADVNKDKKINSIDVTELVYMNNGIIVSN